MGCLEGGHCVTSPRLGAHRVSSDCTRDRPKEAHDRASRISLLYCRSTNDTLFLIYFDVMKKPCHHIDLCLALRAHRGTCVTERVSSYTYVTAYLGALYTCSERAADSDGA